MRLYIDLRSNTLMAAPGIPGTPTVIFKRGRATTLEVQFLADGRTPAKVPANALSFTAKTQDEFDSDPLVHDVAWTIPADDDPDPVYTCNPSFTTTGISDQFLINANPLDDMAKIELMAEINWSLDSGPLNSTETFGVSVFNDVYRDGDVTPTPLTPPDTYERQSNRGQPSGYASINSNGIVVGVPIHINLGFKWQPEPGAADVALLAQAGDFAADGGHAAICTNAPASALDFDLQLDGVSVATITTAEGQSTFTLDADQSTTDAVSKWELVAPATASPIDFSIIVLLRGVTT